MCLQWTERPRARVGRVVLPPFPSQIAPIVSRRRAMSRSRSCPATASAAASTSRRVASSLSSGGPGAWGHGAPRGVRLVRGRATNRATLIAPSLSKAPLRTRGSTSPSMKASAVTPAAARSVVPATSTAGLRPQDRGSKSQHQASPPMRAKDTPATKPPGAGMAREGSVANDDAVLPIACREGLYFVHPSLSGLHWTAERLSRLRRPLGIAS